MLKRRRFNRSSSILEFHLETEALNLRKQAEGMPVSIRRDELLRKANQAETTAQVSNGFAVPSRSGKRMSPQPGPSGSSRRAERV
jgi:hypothetical protein